MVHTTIAVTNLIQMRPLLCLEFPKQCFPFVSSFGLEKDVRFCPILPSQWLSKAFCLVWFFFCSGYSNSAMQFSLGRSFEICVALTKEPHSAVGIAVIPVYSVHSSAVVIMYIIPDHCFQDCQSISLIDGTIRTIPVIVRNWIAICWAIHVVTNNQLNDTTLKIIWVWVYFDVGWTIWWKKALLEGKMLPCHKMGFHMTYGYKQWTLKLVWQESVKVGGSFTSPLPSSKNKLHVNSMLSCIACAVILAIILQVYTYEQ